MFQIISRVKNQKDVKLTFASVYQKHFENQTPVMQLITYGIYMHIRGTPTKYMAYQVAVVPFTFVFQ